MSRRSSASRSAPSIRAGASPRRTISCACPATRALDGAVYYRIDAHFDVQLNVENLLDAHYFVYANSNTNITPGSPTSARLALNVRF